jgi:hypothetical protein
MLEPLPSDPSFPTEEELEKRMRPGAFSKVGFLGRDERLSEVIAQDSETLRDLNLTYAEIASTLEALITAAENLPARKARLGNVECRVAVHQGFQICPWVPDPNRGQCSTGSGVRHASVDWVIANTETGEEMRGPGLIVHLVREHGFFEGRASPNRVDPFQLAGILGLRR